MSRSIRAVAPRESSVLTISSNPADAVTVRAFASAVGRALDLEEESIEDLKLLLTEICAQGGGSDAGAALTIEVEGRAAVVAVTCTGAGPPPHGAEGEQHRERLIHALSPDLRWAEDGRVEFSLSS